jgi:hypothetical protein
MSDNFAQPGNPLTAFTFAEANTYVNNLISFLNSGGTGDRSIDFVVIINNYNPNTGGFFNTFEAQDTIQIRGDVVLQSGPAFNQTNEIVFPFQSWVIAYDRYFPPENVDGTPSSAFGFTVQGGTVNDPAPNGSFGSISVTPGQTYQIIVGTPSGYPFGNPTYPTPAQVNFQFNQG